MKVIISNKLSPTTKIFLDGAERKVIQKSTPEQISIVFSSSEKIKIQEYPVISIIIKDLT